MLKTNEIPFFSKLSINDINSLEAYCEIKEYLAGSTLIEAGEACHYLFALVEGNLSAKLSSSAHKSESELSFTVGSVFAELSLIANMIVPATITATVDSKLIMLSHESFQKIFEEKPSLYESLMRIITTRLQYKSVFELNKFSSYLSIFVVDEMTELQSSCLTKIQKRIQQFCSKSQILNEAGNSVEELEKQVQEWGKLGPIGHPLILNLNSASIFKLGHLFTENDQLVFVDCYDSYKAFKSTFKKPKQVFLAVDSKPIENESRYYYKAVAGGQLDSLCLDRILRFSLKREIGLALGSGAARGFAHLGVLEVMEEEKIPVDFISGTSIGGVIALAYSLTGSVSQTIEIIKEAIGARKKVQDISFFPRKSLLIGNKIKAAALKVFADKKFSDLSIPVEVVSSDLGRALRHNIDSGLLVDAVLATSAIPGIFPPVIKDGRVLVDGALTSKVPVGLLRKRNTALKISVNATKAKGIFSCDPQSKLCEKDSIDGVLYDLTNTFELTKGINLGSIINHSWDLLSWSESSQEASKADIVINPDTSAYSNFAFDAFDELLELGRKAAQSKLAAIKVAHRRLIEPGACVL